MACGRICMLDQSFSAKNFRKIFDYENRKGVYLASKFFPEVHNKSNQIKNCNGTLDDKLELEREKEILLVEALKEVRKVATQKSFTIALEEKDLKDKKMYVPSNSSADYPNLTQQQRYNLAAEYFVLKQTQRNIAKLYKVKQADRYNIVCQLREILKEKFSKCIIKTDVSSFYENITREDIIKKINNDNLLDYRSKKIIKQILYEYGQKSVSEKGIPRGIGISAYLSEIYMRPFDEAIQNSPNVAYYARYVDDIIVVYTPAPNRDSFKVLFKAINDKDLIRNKEKTSISRVDGKASHSIDYLGYNFKFGTGNIKVSLTESKVEKYKKKIDLTFNAYDEQSKYNETKARGLLVRRIRFLTGNTRLGGNKKNICVGIYFSNKILTDLSCLIEIDTYLEDKKVTFLQNDKVRKRLDGLSFTCGFEKKVFYKFSKEDLEEITEAWKNDQ